MVGDQSILRRSQGRGVELNKQALPPQLHKTCCHLSNVQSQTGTPRPRAWSQITRLGEGGVGCSLVGTAVTFPFRAGGGSKGHTLVHGLSSACPSPSIAYCAMEPGLPWGTPKAPVVPWGASSEVHVVEPFL